MIRAVAVADRAWLLALNNAHAVELSMLSGERFAALVSMACFAHVVGVGDAFMMAFDEGAAYDSPNFLWFKARYRRFVYVDRVVVAPEARGRGLARLLYAEVIAHAGNRMLACEVNLDPPNPASDALHASLGFAEVGRAGVGAKVVRYLARAHTTDVCAHTLTQPSPASGRGL